MYNIEIHDWIINLFLLNKLTLLILIDRIILIIVHEFLVTGIKSFLTIQIVIFNYFYLIFLLAYNFQMRNNHLFYAGQTMS